MARKYVGPAGGFVPQTNDPVLAPQKCGVLCPYCKKGDRVFASGMFGKKDLSCTRCKRTFIVVKKKRETEMKTKATKKPAFWFDGGDVFKSGDASKPGFKLVRLKEKKVKSK